MGRNSFFFPSGESKGFDSVGGSRSQDRSTVELSGILRHETDLAWLFFDGTREVWLPKSQVEWIEDKNDHGTMLVPEWLAIKAGVA